MRSLRFKVMIKVLRSLRFKEVRFLGPCGLDRFTTLYPYNLKIVNKFLGASRRVKSESNACLHAA